MSKFKYELGVTLKSLIHGFEGVVMARSEQISGCNVYLVQPRVLLEGKMPDAFWMTESVLVQTEAEQVVAIDDAREPFKFELGVTVKHLVYGLEGIVTARSEWLGNSNRYDVQMVGVTKKGKLKSGHWCDEHALVQLGAQKIQLEPMRKAGSSLVVAAGHR